MQLIDCFSPLISFTLYSREQPETVDRDSADKMHDSFMGLVEQSRQCCDMNGYTAEQREQALFAVVAWIDEFMLCAAEQSGLQWLHYELQRGLFNTSNAGNEFYDRLQTVAPEDKELRDVFTCCLALGFRGRMYTDEETFDAFCQEALGTGANSIGGSLPEPLFTEGYPPEGKGRSRRRSRFLPSSFTLLIFLISIGVLGGLYFFCQQSLQRLYSLLPSIGL